MMDQERGVTAGLVLLIVALLVVLVFALMVEHMGIQLVDLTPTGNLVPG